MSETKRLFVIMPFGKRTIEKSGTPMHIDFDEVYQKLITRSGTDASFIVSRIDEVVAPGRISDQYLEQLYTADVVVADISAVNANVFYELGIRQALNAGPTVLIALDGSEIPFDFRDQRIVFYDKQLSDASFTKLRNVLSRVGEDDTRSPIQDFFLRFGAIQQPRLDTVEFEQELRHRIDMAQNTEQLIGIWEWAKNLSPLPPFALALLSERLSDVNEWSVACDVIQKAIDVKPNDYEMHRRLGWYLRNRGEKFYDLAVSSFLRSLEINPSDPETIGMLAGLFKRRNQLLEAASLYERGLRLSPRNLYMRVNQAAVVLLSSPLDSLAAKKLYSSLYDEVQHSDTSIAEEWKELISGEAQFVLGNFDSAKAHFTRAYNLRTSPNNLKSPADQIELFGKSGFRPDVAAEIAQWLRSLSSAIQDENESVDEILDSDSLPVVIHLSDVHFGTRRGTDGKPVKMHRFEDSDYSLPLSEHMCNEFTKPDSYFRYASSRLILVVSGDLTYGATLAEFDEAHSFIESVCNDLGISKERVIICPGNHDVDWASSAIDPTRRFDNYLSFLRKFYGKDLFEKLYPLVKWDFTVTGHRPKPIDIISFTTISELNIHFLSMNSCVYETPEHHYGFISGKQIRHAEALLQAAGFNRTSTLCTVLHHHLHPYPEPVVLTQGDEHWHDQSTIRDSALVERFLERAGADLVLHGHKHKAQVRETLVRDPSIDDNIQSLLICGAGSCGVESKELEHGIPNQYEVMEFLASYRRKGSQFVRLEWREIAVVPGAEWVTAKRWILTG